MDNRIYEKDLRSLHRQIKRAEDRLSDLKTERDVLIRNTYEKSSLTMEAIASMVGVTKGLVWQIIRDYRRKSDVS